MQEQDWHEDSSKDRCFGVKIPEPITNEGPPLGALLLEFGDTQCLTIHNGKNLYFLEMAEKAVVRYSSYHIPNIKEIVSIIRGYLLVITRDQKLWLFELKKTERKNEPQKLGVVSPAQKSEQKPDGKLQKILTVESFLKQSNFSSYFLREVTPNMVELLIVNGASDRANKIVFVYQFTVKQKVGGMGFTLDKNYKMINHSRQHLYASKNYYDPSIMAIIKLKNFSDQAFSIKKIDAEFLYIIPVSKTEDFYCLNKNYELFHPENSSVKVNIKNELRGFQLEDGIQHINYLLLKNELLQYGLFIIEESMKIRILTVQSSCYKWSICFNGRLVGVKNDKQTIVITEEFNKKTDRLIPPKPEQTKSEGNLTKQIIVPYKDKKDEEVILPLKKKNDKPDNQSLSSSLNRNQTLKKKQTQNIVNSQEKRKEEPEASKHKSNFKPSKIVGRKDLKKQKTEKPQEQQPFKQLQSTDKKTQIVQEQNGKQIQKIEQVLDSPLKEKIPNKQDDKKQDVQEQKENEQIKKIQIKQEKNQKQKNQLNENNAQMSMIENKKESEKLENSALSVKEIERAKLPETVDYSLIKNDRVINKIGQNFIPSANYDEIFGSKISFVLKNGETPFSQATAQPKKQEKKQQSEKNPDLIVQDKIVESDQSQDKQQASKLSQEVQLQQNTSEKKEQQSAEKNQQKQAVQDGSCCNILGQTMDSLGIFVGKIAKLEMKSEEIQDDFKYFQKEVTTKLGQEMKKGESEMIKLGEQKCRESMNGLLQTYLNEYLSKRLTPKVSDYFRSVMGESKKIYQNTVRYYSEKKKQSIISLQNHFQEQQHLVKEIKSISCDLLASVQNTISQGEQSHAYLLKEWESHVKQINSKLQMNMQSLDNHLHDRSASERQKIIDSLGQLRETVQSVNLESQRLKEIAQNEKKSLKQEEVGGKQKKLKKKSVVEETKVKKNKSRKVKYEKQGGNQRGYEAPFMYMPYPYYY